MFFIQFRWQSDLQIEFDLAFFFLWIGMFSEFGTHRYVLNSHRQKLQMIDIWILFWCGKKYGGKQNPYTRISNSAATEIWHFHSQILAITMLLHTTQTHSGGYGNKKKKREREHLLFWRREENKRNVKVKICSHKISTTIPQTSSPYHRQKQQLANS